MTTIARNLFSRAALPGWVLIIASQFKWLYAFVDAWSNLEFISEKIRDIRLLALVAGVFASAWFQIGLIVAGLAWIWVASPQTAGLRSMRTFWLRRPKAGVETEEDVVYFIPRSIADQVADLHRERWAEKFALVQNDRGTREYSRLEVDKLTPTQRGRLFVADREMEAWWRGKSPRTGAWALFRAKGGIWISKHQVDQTPQKHHLDVFQGIPGLLDWYMNGREF